MMHGRKNIRLHEHIFPYPATVNLEARSDDNNRIEWSITNHVYFLMKRKLIYTGQLI